QSCQTAYWTACENISSGEGRGGVGAKQMRSDPDVAIPRLRAEVNVRLHRGASALPPGSLGLTFMLQSRLTQISRARQMPRPLSRSPISGAIRSNRRPRVVADKSIAGERFGLMATFRCWQKESFRGLE